MSADLWQTRFWRNTGTNYLRTLLRLASGLLLFRLTFEHLDTVQFGFFALLWSLFGYTVLLDFGLGFTVQRAVAAATAEGDGSAASRLVATVFWFFAALGAGLFLAGWIGADAFLAWSRVPADRAAEFRTASLAFFACLALGLPAGLFPEVLRGLQRLDLVNWLQIGGTLANVVLLGTALLLRWPFASVLLISAATAVVPNALAAVPARRLLPALRWSWRLFDPGAVRGVLAFSVVAYLITFTNVVMARTDQAVIGFSVGVAAIAVYQAGAKVSEMFGLFSIQLQEALTPAAARLHARRDHAALVDLLARGTQLTTAIVVPLGALCLVYLEPLVRLLTGLETVDRATYWTGVALIVATLGSLLTNSCAKRVLMMCGWERRLLWASLVDATLNLVLSLVLVRKLGVVGVAIGTLVPTLLVGTCWILPLTVRFTGWSWRETLVRLYGPALRSILVAAAVLGLLVVCLPAARHPHLLDLVWRGLLVGAAAAFFARPLLLSFRHG